jgi:imidazolonepropionase
VSGVLIRNARVVTLSGEPGPRRGPAMRELSVLPSASVLVQGETIERVAESITPPPSARVIDAAGRVLMPGFVDAHTHACWVGDRTGEWEARLAGASYLELLERGGGIMATVRAVRAASEDALTRALLGRLDRMLELGTTTVEVKSGYGLETETELKMLRAISAGAGRWPGRVVPTACIGHALDPDAPGLIDRTIDETLPAVHEAFPGITVDAYCERGAWSLDDCVRLFSAAVDLGHPVRVHADQFTSLGMTRAAIDLGALSVDHLEAATPDDLRVLGASGVIGGVLPCSGFHLDDRYADGRSLIDAGGAVFLATNANPGSAPCFSIPQAVALSVRKAGLTPAEAIAACTVNAAGVLGFDDIGRVEPGCRADLVLLRHAEEGSLAHEFGDNPVDVVVCAGRVVSERRVRA